MAGDPNEARLFVLLLLITVYMRLVLFRRRNRFQQRLRLLALRGRSRVMEAYFYHPRRKICRRRKVAWVLERPQFWFENMVLKQYADNIWQEHFRISRQTFQFACNLVGPHLVRQDTNMRCAIPVRVEKRVAVALWRLATGNSYRTTGLVFGVRRCTALKLKGEFCSALLTTAKDFNHSYMSPIRKIFNLKSYRKTC